MCRGNGRLQRRILELLEQSAEGKEKREELDRVLVDVEGFDPSNVLRAIKGLARKHRVGFTDRRRKRESLVSLPRKVEPITEDAISALLAEIGDKGGRK
jgi:hypothetical protein